MSISERVHALAMVIVAGVLSSTIFISTLTPVQAATVDSSISCFVYTTLNDFGVPQQFQAGKCPATPTQGGAITLVKRVVNTGAGIAVPSDFLLHLTSAGTDVGGSPQQGTSTGMTYSGLTPGIYMVRESGAPLGYSMSFSGNCDINGILSISAGTIAFCVVTDTYAAQGTGQSTTAQSTTTSMQAATPTGTLDVVKLVAGANATSSQASIHVLTSAGSDVAGSPQKASALGTPYILTPGMYSVIDSGMSGYTASFAGNCMMGGSIVVTPAGISTCIITATPVSGTSAASSLVQASADLSMRAIATKPIVNRGDIVTYSLFVTNTGPAAASGVFVHNLLPPGLIYVSDDSSSSHSGFASTTGIWNVGSLSSGASAALHIAASVLATSTGTIFSDTATVSGTVLDMIPGNNSATTTVVMGSDSTSPLTMVVPPLAGQVAGVATSTSANSTPTTTTAPSTQTSQPAHTTHASSGIVPTATSCGALLTGFIKPGGTNDRAQVARLQAFLKVYEGASVSVSGNYDAQTIAATEAFQSKFKDDILTPWGISAPTGYVYLTTRHMVNEVYCRFSQTFPLSQAEQSIVSQGRTDVSSGSSAAISGNPHVTGKPVKVDLQPIDSATAVESSSTIVSSPMSNVVQFFRDPFGGLFHWLGSLGHSSQ